MGLGSIPFGILCLGGLCTYLCLSAFSYVAEQPITQTTKEVPMKQTERNYSSRIKKSLISTAWAIGTGMWSGVALSG